MANARQLMAARSAWSGGAKGPTARDYIQSGLWLLWDGIENAGWGRHDSSLTIWTDLLSGCVLNSTNGKFAFSDRSFDWTSRDNLISTNLGDELRDNMSKTNQTLEVVCTKASGGCALQANNGLQSWIRGRIGAGSDGSLSFGSASDIEGPVHIAITGDGVVGKIFVNGVSYGQTDAIVDSYSKLTARWLGFNRMANGSSGEENSGSVYAIRHYTRCLTLDEIAHNYAVDTARFGLT